MRYLTIEEVRSAGYEPYLIYNGDVYTYRDSKGALHAPSSLGYEALVLFFDFDMLEISSAVG